MKLSSVLTVTLSCAACSPAPRAGDSAIEPSASTAPIELASATVSASPAPTESAPPGAAVPLEAQEHTLDARVKSVSAIGTKSGTGVFSVDADPRFVVELELFGVAPGMADDPPGSVLTAGSVVSFAIHSPARLFKSNGDMAGKRMHFSVTRTRTKGGVSFSALHAE